VVIHGTFILDLPVKTKETVEQSTGTRRVLAPSLSWPRRIPAPNFTRWRVSVERFYHRYYLRPKPILRTIKTMLEDKDVCVRRLRRFANSSRAWRNGEVIWKLPKRRRDSRENRTRDHGFGFQADGKHRGPWLP